MEALGQALCNAEVPVAVPIDGRIKSFASVVDKIGASGGRYSGPDDLQDLVGLRIITPFRRDIDAAADCVERSFRIFRRYDTEHRLADDQFGYSSLHYVVGAPYEWGDTKLLTLRAEVQVRTMAQHLWAVASHVLQYKSTSAVPADLRRAVNRSAALLELVDLEFDRLLQEREFYRQRIEAADGEQPLDVDALVTVLESLWPAENRKPDEPYARLLRECENAGIASPAALAELITRQRQAVLRDSKRRAGVLARAIEQDGIVAGVVTTRLPDKTIHSQGLNPDHLERLKAGVYYGHVALTVAAIRFEQGKRNLGTDLLF
jgi:putative GTP pyrophosphokinase